MVAVAVTGNAGARVRYTLCVNRHAGWYFEVSAWGMGFMIVDDYLSPLLTGAVVRPTSDHAGVPREKLAFILDSTTASVCIRVPFTAWGAYIARPSPYALLIALLTAGLCLWI